MILVDTSIWIDHLRSADEVLSDLIDRDRLLMHPFILGELALGSFASRAALLSNLSTFPEPVLALASEVLVFIERHRLHGTGIGYVDTHLLASVMLTEGASLWTRDKRLRAVAERLSLGAKLSH